MKYLEYSPFEEINAWLNSGSKGDVKLLGRIEAYSCKHRCFETFSRSLLKVVIHQQNVGKPVGTDKKLYKQLEHRYYEDLEQASTEYTLASPVGPLNEPTSRKTLYFLIGILNSSFADYDFSNIRAEHFTKQPSLNFVFATVNALFLNLSDSNCSEPEKIWVEIDKEIELKDCEIYTFLPDPDADPFSENGSM